MFLRSLHISVSAEELLCEQNIPNISSLVVCRRIDLENINKPSFAENIIKEVSQKILMLFVKAFALHMLYINIFSGSSSLAFLLLLLIGHRELPFKAKVL